MNSEFAVTVNKLSVAFDGFYAVKDISFSVKRGEIFGFLGANGAGKTTTIRVLCGLLHPSDGSVSVGGIPFNSNEDELKIKKIVGYMSQKFTLYNDLTVQENLEFMASLRGLNSKFYKERRDFILKFISFNQSLKSYVKNLSGGIKQQVSLAASILHDPEIIFLDEPTAGVSPQMRSRFWALIRELSKLGKTVFVTTHYMDEAEQCERIALMRAGQIVALDSPENLKKATFKKEVFEFTPRTKINYSRIQSLRKHSDIEFFEPYGLRFHVVFKNSKEGEKLKEDLKKDFEMKIIQPTLEDVFIKTTEELST